MSELNKVGLTAEQLKDVLKTVVEEARKPVVTEEQQRALESAKQTRREGAEQFKAMQKGIADGQLRCTHMNKNRSSAAVEYKNGKNTIEFLICQHCHIVVKPYMPDGTTLGDGSVIDGVHHNLELFNRIMIQKNDGGMF